MRVLEGFCRLVVGLDVKDRVGFESIAFVYECVKESDFVLRSFSCEFDRRVELVCLLNEQIDVVLVLIPEGEKKRTSSIRFHSIGLILLWRMSFVSTSAMKMFAKATAGIC